MKATLALLANREVSNWVRKLSWQIHEHYHTGTQHCRLPPHISLKQPFRISDLTALEVYLNKLAHSLEPFEVRLAKFQLVPIVFEGTEYGMLWIDVQETDYLRQLHTQLNQELSQRFGNIQAEYDGSAYHFHMSVMLGGQPMEVYRRIYDEISDRSIPLGYTVQELALFVYDEPMGPNGEYLTYKIVPIGSEHT